jgi:hypothetical protein
VGEVALALGGDGRPDAIGATQIYKADILTVDEEKTLGKIFKKVIAKRRRNHQTQHPDWVIEEVMLVIDSSGEIERTNPQRAAAYRARIRALLSPAIAPTPFEAWLDEIGR